MTRKMLPISKEDHALLKQYCKERGLKMNYVVSDLIKKYCNQPSPDRIMRSEKVK
jgi:hypothetical protein